MVRTIHLHCAEKCQKRRLLYRIGYLYSLDIFTQGLNLLGFPLRSLEMCLKEKEKKPPKAFLANLTSAQIQSDVSINCEYKA